MADEVNGNDFTEALKQLCYFNKVRRSAWKGKEYVYTVGETPTTQRHLVKVSAAGFHLPGWTPTNDDLFAQDWQLVKQ